MKTLIVMALQEEGGHYFENEGIKIIYTGLGKVNAAYQLTKALCIERPDLVINFGTAGSQKFNRGDMVAVNRFIQRDIDVSPLGYEKGQTPFENVPSIINHKTWFKNLEHGSCGTGDSFEIDHKSDNSDLVDMEAFALAKICFLENIDFACVKYISDGADDNAHGHWEESIKDIPAHFLELYKSYFT